MFEIRGEMLIFISDFHFIDGTLVTIMFLPMPLGSSLEISLELPVVETN